MSYADEEANFEQRYRSGNYCKDLWELIPKKLYNAITEAIVDSDGYWVYIAQGYSMDGERVIHSYNITGIKEDLKRITKDI